MLSDCVVALKVRSEDGALELRDHILSHWASFRALYRGTGAPYTTLRRIGDWIGPCR